ncbi:hypothetical protein ASPNIDRAFT_39002 [Aspergillus niger ATCC 1015]|uniref:Transcription factor domain-containing protein n=1 Tax=Aspergillus niger (strain ATCC 1015 / CBS 113.46 / FGSC A1144 / LSHB Ac4 / NCTC 3858a / NRRL 328 / USDA 3528.7) TaxID=380704 RepID=G3YCQ0_ASPNA|nr:hypothetical protein ASPNIDRAFT_39002 [Aspergillus niger ATCC 1015]
MCRTATESLCINGIRRPGAVPLPVSARNDLAPEYNEDGSFLDGDFHPCRLTSPTRSGTYMAAVNSTTDSTINHFIRSLFPDSEPFMASSGILAFSYLSPTDQLPITGASNPDLRFLPRDLAVRCFDLYIASLWHLNPFQPINLLQASLCDVLGVWGSNHSSSAIDQANALAILALGASYRYRTILRLDHQLTIYHAQYQSHINQHAQAYAILDDARCKLSLIELDTHTDLASTEPARGIQKSSIIVTLIAFERYMALCLGLPSHFPDDLCPPDDQLPPALYAINKFSLVASQITQIQQKLQGDLGALTQASYELHQRLNLFLLEASNKCRSLYIGERQRADLNILISVHLAGPYAVRAAKSIIYLIGQAFHSGSLIKDLPPNGSFIESACLSLLLAGLCDGSDQLEQYLVDIRNGIGYLMQMSCQFTVAERIQNLRDLSARVALGDYEAVVYYPIPTLFFLVYKIMIENGSQTSLNL